MEAELILFAKTPVAGQVKTRMIPDFGEEGSAKFAAALIQESVRRAVDAWPGSVSLQVWPDTQHKCFREIEQKYNVKVSRQANGSLGVKMFEALNAAYRHGSTAAIMGCDVPQCPAETFRAAHAFLTQGRSIIGPSDDGGYYLIGINPPHPDCFDSIHWGDDKVFYTTLKHAAAVGIGLMVMQQLNDLDTASDVEKLRSSHPTLVKRLMSHLDVS